MAKEWSGWSRDLRNGFPGFENPRYVVKSREMRRGDSQKSYIIQGNGARLAPAARKKSGETGNFRDEFPGSEKPGEEVTCTQNGAGHVPQIY